MKKKKGIIIKDPHLRKIRDNLRVVIDRAVNNEVSRFSYLMRQIDRSTDEGRNQYFALMHRRDDLRRANKSSTIQCAVCNFGIDRDIRFNPFDGAWYCIECYDLIRDQYYITMAKKERGEFIGTDYNEDYARSFTD
ncbi:hypothetical protein ES708_14084 [subsurface metagenome]